MWRSTLNHHSRGHNIPASLLFSYESLLIFCMCSSLKFTVKHQVYKWADLQFNYSTSALKHSSSFSLCPMTVDWHQFPGNTSVSQQSGVSCESEEVNFYHLDKGVTTVWPKAVVLLLRHFLVKRDGPQSGIWRTGGRTSTLDWRTKGHIVLTFTIQI